MGLASPDVLISFLHSGPFLLGFRFVILRGIEEGVEYRVVFGKVFQEKLPGVRPLTFGKPVDEGVEFFEGGHWLYLSGVIFSLAIGFAAVEDALYSSGLPRFDEG